MNILIIAVGVGNSPAGIIYKRVIQALAKHNDITVVANADFDINCDIKKIIIPIIEIPGKLLGTLKFARVVVSPSSPNDLRPSPIVKDTLRLINCNIFDRRWSNRVIESTNDLNFDFVLALTAFIEFAQIYAAKEFAALHKCKWGVYSVDPIPIPKEWGTSPIQIRNCKKMLRTYFSYADLVCFSNPRMLEYDIELFTPKYNAVLDYLYTPSPSNEVHITKSLNRKTFLYTGSLYGRRNAKYCLSAFKRILKLYPEVKLVFVGTNLPRKCKKLLSGDELKSVELYPFQKNLESFYRDSVALIDIDADYKNDVFLSSKIVTYIKVNRPIISETSSNSPSRLLFSNIESVIQCEHDEDEIYLAMKKILDGFEYNYNDRRDVINKISSDYFSDKFQSLIKRII